MQYCAAQCCSHIKLYQKMVCKITDMLVNNTSKVPPAHTALHNPVDLPNSYQNIVRPTKISRFPVFLFEVL